MRFSAPSTFLAAAFLFAGASASAERPAELDTSRTTGVQLEYKFERGDAHNFVFDWNYTSEELEGGDGDSTTASISMPITHEVQSIANGTGVIATSLQSPTVTRTVNEEPVSPGGLGSALQAARLSSNISSDGSVEESTGMISSDTPHDTTVVSFLNDAFALHWVQFPSEPVTIGDSWLQSEQETEGGLTSVLSARYTLVGFHREAGRELAVVDTVYTYAVDGQVVAERSGRPARVVARGHGEGHLLFDYERGQIHELGIRIGTILTSTETSGVHSSSAFSHDGTLRAQVVAAAVPE